jgi:hypothetical protein
VGIEPQKEFIEKLLYIIGDPIIHERFINVLLGQHSNFVIKCRFLQGIYRYQCTKPFRKQRMLGNGLIQLFLTKKSSYYIKGIPLIYEGLLHCHIYQFLSKVFLFLSTEMSKDSLVCQCMNTIQQEKKISKKDHRRISL